MKMKKITLSIFAALAMSFGSFAQTVVLPWNSYGTPNDYQYQDKTILPANYQAKVGDIIHVHIAGTSNFDLTAFQAAAVDVAPPSYFTQLSNFKSFGTVTGGTPFDYSTDLPVTAAIAVADLASQVLVLDATSAAAGGTAGTKVTLTLTTFTVTVTAGQAGVTVLTENGTTGTFQATFPDTLKTTPAVQVGDVVEVTVAGTSNIDIANFQTAVIDETKAAAYWKELDANFTMLGSGSVTAGTPFNLSAQVTIVNAPLGSGEKSQDILLYGEAPTGSKMDLTLTTFTAKIISGPTGIKEVSAKTNNFAIYPNPVTNGEINFRETISNIYIYNTQGALVKSAAQANNLDVSDLAHGLYIIKTSKGISKFAISE